MTQLSEEMNSASNRRWLYGFNVALLVVVAVAILGCLFYFSANHSKHVDMTSAGLYSLSGSTKNLLKEIDEKKQHYDFISMFPPSPSASQDERREQVTDELDEYARGSASIKVEEGWSLPRDEVDKRIRALYSNELKPYEESIGQFDKLAADLGAFLKDEGANIGALAQKPGTPAATVRQAAQLQGEFTSRAPEALEDARRTVRKATEAALPQWSTVTETVKTTVDGLAKQIDFFSDPAKIKGTFEPAIEAYLVSAAPRYKAIAEKLNAYHDKLDKLAPLKVDGVLSALGANTVLILGPHEARVVPESDLYVPGAPAQGSQEQAMTFVGEQAISSALMAMIQPEKVKVVFVSPTPEQLISGMYSEMADILRQNNFDVLEWSPPGPPTGPDQPPQSPTPPAQGKGVVWIVFPPGAPNQQMMMMGMPPPDPRPVIEAVRKHMEAGGQTLFLADGSGGGFMGGGEYPYEGLLRDFGVNVQTKYTVVRQREGQDPDTGEAVRQVIPMVQVDEFQPHEITQPLNSLPLVMASLQGRAGDIGIPTVVSRSSTMPKDAEAVVLFQTPGSADYWGESQYTPNATFDKSQDFAPPCPLAVAATRFKGQKDKEQRVVVIGSSTIAANPLLDASQLVLVGAQPQEVARFPGNSELVRNSVLWLAGYENMIAVSSKARVALRIHDISPGALEAIRWGILFGGAPVAALLVGGIVWFARRR